MKAIKIDPFKRDITAIDIAGGLEALQGIVGGLIEPGLSLPNGDILFVNEEGLFAREKAWFLVDGNPQPLTGCGVVIGHDEDGETRDVQASSEDIVAKVTWLDPDDVGVGLRMAAPR